MKASSTVAWSSAAGGDFGPVHVRRDAGPGREEPGPEGREARWRVPAVTDADIGGRWLKVVGKGQRERRVPLDADVASVIQVIS